MAWRTAWGRSVSSRSCCLACSRRYCGPGVWGLQPDGLDADVGAAAAGPLPELGVDVGLFVVEHLAADLALGHLQPVAVAVDGDDPLGPEQHGRPGGHLADPATAPDGDHVAGLHPAQVGPHPPGRGRVGGEQPRHVIDLVGDLERDLVGVGDPHVLGVAALEAAHGVGVAEDPGRVVAP